MTLKRLSTGFPIGSLILAIVGLTCAGLTRLHSQRTTPALVDPEDPSSEQPLQQPGDPSRSELSPEEALLPGDEAGEVSPESTPAEEGARGSENAEDEEEANGDVIISLQTLTTFLVASCRISGSRKVITRDAVSSGATRAQ